jgi:hypothetical protein
MGAGMRKEALEGESSSPRRIERINLHLEITQHIFANSPAMLALCLTSIGLIKIYAQSQRISTWADDGLLFAVIAFLIATGTSYLALRSRMGRFKILMARLSDAFFIIGIVVVSGAAVVMVRTLAG